MATYNPNLTLSGSISKRKIYYHTRTKNMSFIKMYNILDQLGVENNKFFLEIKNPLLRDVDPFNPNLDMATKAMILEEVKNNFWYFIRECVRIPTSGGLCKYTLHRGNLAMNFCFMMNLNMIVELPRQNFKTVSAVCWYLWLYNFGTQYTQMSFTHTRHEMSKKNLKDLKNIRDNLPSYLRFNTAPIIDGKQGKFSDNVESAENPRTHNHIITKAGASTKAQAENAGRGNTQAAQWYDEFHFIKFNSIIYAAATPAFKQASDSAKANGKPYGILITSTPGDINTEHGQAGMDMIKGSTIFREDFYNMSAGEIREQMKAMPAPFMYIKFSYSQLGRDSEWFEDSCANLLWKESDIRREILLEWGNSNSECPFTEDELEAIRDMTRDPVRSIPIKIDRITYHIDLYSDLEIDNPMILGVDVSGAYNKDSSAITIISSKTTKVIGTFNNPIIGNNEFSRLISALVSQYMPNAVVVIERNSYGEGIISNLRHSPIKHQLYYEYKTAKASEKVSNGFVSEAGRTSREFGVFTTGKSRDEMMEILRDRVDNHKDKFIAPLIYNQMCGLVNKKGRIDHSTTSHDDNIMAMLVAMHAYFHGTNLAQYGIKRYNIAFDSYANSNSEYVNDMYNGNLILDAEVNDFINNHPLLDAKPVALVDEWVKRLEMEKLDLMVQQTQLFEDDLSSRSNMPYNFGSQMFKDLNNFDSDGNDKYDNWFN